MQNILSTIYYRSVSRTYEDFILLIQVFFLKNHYVLNVLYQSQKVSKTLPEPVKVANTLILICWLCLLTIFKIMLYSWTIDILKSVIVLCWFWAGQYSKKDSLFTWNEKKIYTKSTACKHRSTINYSLSNSIITLWYKYQKFLGDMKL